MLNENIKIIRKSKGLSQEELAVKLNVVRQTVSKWEQGLSVPDAEMLISVSEALETPVSTLLGETVMEAPAEDLKVIAEKLEVINRQLAKRTLSKWKALYWLLFSLAVIIVALFAFLTAVQSPYLNWNFNDPETAIAGTVLHAFEYLFVRTAPVIFIGIIAGIVLVRRKMDTR